MDAQDGPGLAGGHRRPGRRVLIVAHYVSERSGGEGSIPLRLFGRLRERGAEAWLLTHVSARDQLITLLPAAEFERVIFARGMRGFGSVYVLGKRLPSGLRTIAWSITQLERQIAMVAVVRRLVRELAIDVVHQPISVSPVIPSPLTRLGAPVVMGPLNGGMELPPSFRERDSRLYALTKAARPVMATVLNGVMRGRAKADVILVANDRTRSLLPRSVQKTAAELSDIGVVLDSWVVPDKPVPRTDACAGSRVTRFLFVGRLVSWKGADLLIDAFALVSERIPALLEIVGDGPERDRLVRQAARSKHGERVVFLGWLEPEDCARRTRACDVFVSASLQESGGIAVLEAMACARPVIVTAWGGHLGSVDERVGILVDVSSRAATVQGLAEAMTRLASDTGLAARLGACGRRRVEARYDWNIITDRTLLLYDQACGSRHAPELSS